MPFIASDQVKTKFYLSVSVSRHALTHALLVHTTNNSGHSISLRPKLRFTFQSSELNINTALPCHNKSEARQHSSLLVLQRSFFPVDTAATSTQPPGFLRHIPSLQDNSQALSGYPHQSERKPTRLQVSVTHIWELKVSYLEIN